jgi:ATP-binding cassette subfamily B protein
MLVVTAVLGVCSVAAVYLGARIAMGFGRDVRLAVFQRVEGFSQVEMNKFGTPSLITRNTNDVQQVQMIVFMGLTVILLAPIMGIGGVIMALRQDVPLSALLLVILPIMFGFIFFITSRAVPLFRAMQVKVDRINQVMREALAGVRVIRAFVRVDHEEKRFDEANVDLFQTGLKVNRLFALTFPVMMLIFNLSSVAVIWFGAFRVNSGDMPIGNLTAFLSYLMQIMFSVLMAIFMIIFLPRAVVSAGRIREVLETEPSIVDPESPVSLPIFQASASGDGNGHGADGNGFHPGTDTRRPPRGQVFASSSRTLSFATREPSSPSCTTSHSQRSQARRRPSSVARAAANQP